MRRMFLQKRIAHANAVPASVNSPAKLVCVPCSYMATTFSEIVQMSSGVDIS